MAAKHRQSARLSAPRIIEPVYAGHEAETVHYGPAILQDAATLCGAQRWQTAAFAGGGDNAWTPTPTTKPVTCAGCLGFAEWAIGATRGVHHG